MRGDGTFFLYLMCPKRPSQLAASFGWFRRKEGVTDLTQSGK
jgi:hypothetical protein